MRFTSLGQKKSGRITSSGLTKSTRFTSNCLRKSRENLSKLQTTSSLQHLHKFISQFTTPTSDHLIYTYTSSEFTSQFTHTPIYLLVYYAHTTLHPVYTYANLPPTLLHLHHFTPTLLHLRQYTSQFTSTPVYLPLYYTQTSLPAFYTQLHPRFTLPWSGCGGGGIVAAINTPTSSGPHAKSIRRGLTSSISV